MNFLIKPYPSIKDFDIRINKFVNRKKCLDNLNKKLNIGMEKIEPHTNLKRFVDKFSKLENEKNTKDSRLNSFQKDNTKSKSYLRVINNLKKKHEISVRSSKPIQILGIPLRSNSSPKNVQVVSTPKNNNPYYVQSEQNTIQVKNSGVIRNTLLNTLNNGNNSIEQINLLDKCKLII
jgi:hypothetical protein